MIRPRRVKNRRLKGGKFEREMVRVHNEAGHEAYHNGGSHDGGADLILKLRGVSRTLRPQCKSNTKCWHDLYVALREGNGVAFLKDNHQKPVIAMHVEMWLELFDPSRERPVNFELAPIKVADWA